METDERRIYRRFRILADIKIQVKNQNLMAVAYDISQGGIKFVTPEVIFEGAICVIAIKKAKFKYEGIVKWSGYTDNKQNMKKYGIEFTEPLLEDDFKIYLDILLSSAML